MLQLCTTQLIQQCYLPPGRGDIPAFTPANDSDVFHDYNLAISFTVLVLQLIQH